MKKKVKIFDRQYELEYYVESDETADRIIKYVDRKYKEVGKHSKTKSLPEIALLVSLDLADELIKEKRRHKELIQIIETGIGNLENIKRGSLSCS